MKSISSFDEFPNQYDILVVGAGPSGCAVSGYLSNSFNTLLIDAVSFPRDKPCGGVLKEEALDFLRGFDIPSEVLIEPEKLNLRYLDWDNNIEAHRDRYLVNVSRSKFDDWLTTLVGGSVDFSTKTRFLNFKEYKEWIEVTLEKNNIIKKIRCKYLVDATGSSIAIRKNLSKTKLTTYVAIQEWIKSTEEIKDFVYISDSGITDFYSWLLPKENLIIVGTAIPMNGNLVREKFSLLKEKVKKNLHVSGSTHKKEASLIIRPKSLDELFLGNERILVVGEAAGLLSSVTGEGISYALRSGYFCAKAINNMRDVSSEYKEYCKPLVAEINTKIKKAQVFSDPVARKNLLLKLSK